MRVSVVIPVYNAADYVQQAVESALAQPETAEVILVEDGSTDRSLSICQKLAAQIPIVRLHRHPGGENCGAGASRNLGILNSASEYVAFLDADDYYLPDRFSVAKQLLEKDAGLDGVYEAVGLHMESSASMERWTAAGHSVQNLCTITEEISPEDLFGWLVRGGVGFFHVNGLVARRDVYIRAGLYDEHLFPHEDEAMNLRMAAVARLAPGRLREPVAVYRIHERNSISAPKSPSQKYKARIMMYQAVWRWSRDNLDNEKQQAVLNLLVRRARGMSRSGKDFPLPVRFLQGRLQLLMLSFECPHLLGTRAFWRYFLPSFRFWVERLFA